MRRKARAEYCSSFSCPGRSRIILVTKVIQRRATVISLVCYAWYSVEREHPHCPLLLHIRPKDFNDSFMTWHLRDTSRLREVKVLRDHCRDLTSEGYQGWLPRMLQHVSINAPALRSLDIIVPFRFCCTTDDLLPRLGALSQLESLVLRDWRYATTDIAVIHHLTRLQNLKVIFRSLNHGNANENENLSYAVVPALCLTCSLNSPLASKISIS